jgi:hypothetical protein
MRSIKTTSGTRLELDGDVLAVIEAVSRDLMRSRALDYGFDEVDREFSHLVSQMSEEELRAYLKESLFMSFNRYENEHLAELIRKANQVQDVEKESEE